MTIKPLGSFVLVKPLKEADEEKTAGGLYVPGIARQKDGVALVLAAGDAVEFQNGQTRPLRVKAGDKVLYDVLAGVKTKVDGEDCLLVRENDCYAIIE